MNDSKSSLPSPAGSTHRSTGGGICSALLEVIEKLRDEEESHQPELNESCTKVNRKIKKGIMKPKIRALNGKRKIRNQLKKAAFINEIIDESKEISF